jgi:hypothetical protein
MLILIYYMIIKASIEYTYLLCLPHYAYRIAYLVSIH